MANGPGPLHTFKTATAQVAIYGSAMEAGSAAAAEAARRLREVIADAEDLADEIARYSQLLLSAPIDMDCVGFGENGHIAFNDPPVADFNDPATVKVVTLDEACRQQQAGEGHFADAASVPAHAVTITCPGLFRARLDLLRTGSKESGGSA
ncbi:MAG TPA: hypothetical protein VH351_06310 [Bryobacteraceae bacterium]|nr:hypothetical protein [Bryobacteraceae bacterium]